MGINIIGTFVHDARLQYLEFFSKWYAEGGKPFEPLRILTKYVDVANVDVAKSKQEENAL
jgi:V/A-type H+-transporting ATPase subunit I